MNKNVIAGTGLFLLLTWLLFQKTFLWLYERYTAADSYYTHGFLVPFIAAYLIWLKKDALRALTKRRSFGGLALVVAALLVHAAGTIAGVYFVSGYALFLFAFGVPLWLFGRRLTQEIFFPLVFLFFMFPLPLAAINAVSFPLRLFATKSAVAVLHFAGLPVVSEGFRILFPHDSLVVGDPCSGLRSLIGLTAMGSVFAYLLKGSTAARLSLFAAAIPIALLSNIVRLVVLCLAAYCFGSASTEGLFHDATGYAVFLLAFAVLRYGGKELEKRGTRSYA